MASELHPWRFKLEIFPSRLPWGHWAQTECSAGCDLWSIFFEMLWAEHIVVFWFPLLCGWVPSIHCHLPLSFSGFIFKRKSMERKLLCQLFTATSCSTLARHALKLNCQTTFDSTLLKSLLSHAGQLPCRDVTEVTWPKPGIFSCRRRSCPKRRVCFHSNQYFYVPQENVNVSNEQRVC